MNGSALVHLFITRPNEPLPNLSYIGLLGEVPGVGAISAAIRLAISPGRSSVTTPIGGGVLIAPVYKSPGEQPCS